MTTHAVRLEVAGATATVVSDDQAVTDWAARYVGPWWNVTAVEAESRSRGSVVIADVDSDRYEDMAVGVTRAPHMSVAYARAMLLVARDASDGVVRAVCPEQRLAYRSEPGRGELHVIGCDTEAVATATARLTRETARGQLLRDGWAVLHASAVVDPGGRAILTFGQKGAGKTTTALVLAAWHGMKLLANDRVFVRVNGDGGVDVLPWPSAAALGLGLLDGLGWFDIVQERLDSGEALHPTQDGRVTAALRAGRREPLWEGGKELKAQVFPDQFPSWFGVPLATSGVAGALVFPRIEQGAVPAIEDGDGRGLTDADFMSGKAEDRYPDVFELARVDGGGAAEARHEVMHRLAELPHHAVLLGHDVAENADLLAKMTGCV